jgi:hypothetical protein
MYRFIVYKLTLLSEPLSRVPGSLNHTYYYGVNYMYGIRQ